MKAIVLAAGLGKRLGDVTKDTPKPMLKIRGESILEHNLRWLKKNGIRNVYINLHHRGEVIRDTFGGGETLDMNIKYSVEEELLGTTGAVKKIRDDFDKELGGEFLVVYGDNYFPQDYDLTRFEKFHQENKGILSVGVYKNDAELRKSGVTSLDDHNRIAAFVEKPDEEAQTEFLKKPFYIHAGLFIMTKESTEKIPAGESDFGRDVLPLLLRDFRDKIFGFVFPPGIVAIDNPQLYTKVKEEMGD